MSLFLLLHGNDRSQLIQSQSEIEIHTCPRRIGIGGSHPLIQENLSFFQIFIYSSPGPHTIPFL